MCITHCPTTRTEELLKIKEHENGEESTEEEALTKGRLGATGLGTESPDFVALPALFLGYHVSFKTLDKGFLESRVITRRVASMTEAERRPERKDWIPKDPKDRVLILIPPVRPF